jgi:hypothetical protein
MRAALLHVVAMRSDERKNVYEMRSVQSLPARGPVPNCDTLTNSTRFCRLAVFVVDGCQQLGRRGLRRRRHGRREESARRTPTATNGGVYAQLPTATSRRPQVDRCGSRAADIFDAQIASRFRRLSSILCNNTAAYVNVLFIILAIAQRNCGFSASDTAHTYQCNDGETAKDIFCQSMAER